MSSESVKKAIRSLEKAAQMGECLTKILEFVDSKGLGDELTNHLLKLEDPYFLRFLKEKTT